MSNQIQNLYKIHYISQEGPCSNEVKVREHFDFDEYKRFIDEHMRTLQDLDQKISDQSLKKCEHPHG
jgi:hypothetical protein